MLSIISLEIQSNLQEDLESKRIFLQIRSENIFCNSFLKSSKNWEYFNLIFYESLLQHRLQACRPRRQVPDKGSDTIPFGEHVPQKRSQQNFPLRFLFALISHIPDCPFTRKKVCYCKCHESALMPPEVPLPPLKVNFLGKRKRTCFDRASRVGVSRARKKILRKRPRKSILRVPCSSCRELCSKKK